MAALPVTLLFACIAGWVINLVKLFECDFQAPYKGEIIHTAGALIPYISPITVWFNDK